MLAALRGLKASGSGHHEPKGSMKGQRIVTRRIVFLLLSESAFEVVLLVGDTGCRRTCVYKHCQKVADNWGGGGNSVLPDLASTLSVTYICTHSAPDDSCPVQFFPLLPVFHITPPTRS